MSKERKEINKDKLKALEVTLGKIEKDFGKGTIMKLGDHAIENIQVILSWLFRLKLSKFIKKYHYPGFIYFVKTCGTLFSQKEVNSLAPFN